MSPESLPVYWLPKANDSRARQLGYLAKRNPKLAIAVGDAIMAAVAKLADDPDLSRVGRIAGAREYRIPDTPFLLVYRIEQEAVVILRLLHHRRRFVTAEDAGIDRKDKRKPLAPRTNRRVPSLSSRLFTSCPTAAGVTLSSAAAAEKLRCRALASNARKAFR